MGVPCNEALWGRVEMGEVGVPAGREGRSGCPCGKGEVGCPIVVSRLVVPTFGSREPKINGLRAFRCRVVEVGLEESLRRGSVVFARLADSATTCGFGDVVPLGRALPDGRVWQSASVGRRWAARPSCRTQAAARAQRGRVRAGTRWRQDITRSSHDFGSPMPTGGARSFTTEAGVAWRMPPVHST